MISDYIVSAVLAALLAAVFASVAVQLGGAVKAAEAQAARAAVLAGALKASDGYWYAVVAQVGGWRPFKFVLAGGARIDPPPAVYCARQFYIAPHYLCVYRLDSQPVAVAT